MKNKQTHKKRAVTLFVLPLIVTALIFAGCSDPANSGGGDGGDGGGGSEEVSYISYDRLGNRYTLNVKQNNSKAAYTPENGDTYTFTVDGFNSGESTGTVTSFSGNSYTLSNNGAPLALTVSGETITEITNDAPIEYNGGGSRKPDGSWSIDTPLLGTWGTNPCLTITAAGSWTFSYTSEGAEESYSYSGTYIIGDTTIGIPYYALYPGNSDLGNHYAYLSEVTWPEPDHFPVVSDPNKIALVFETKSVNTKLTRQGL